MLPLSAEVYTNLINRVVDNFKAKFIVREKTGNPLSAYTPGCI
jgi:hypothetical protein